MRKLVTYDAPVKLDHDKLSVGDVVATQGTAQRLRAIEAITFTSDGVKLDLATPKTSAQPQSVTLRKGIVLVHGRVEGIEAKPKARKATAKNPAPVKVTKVDAVSQTTPPEAKPAPRAKQSAVKATPAPTGIRALIRERIQQVILAEIDSALAEALS